MGRAKILVLELHQVEPSRVAIEDKAAELSESRAVRASNGQNSQDLPPNSHHSAR